MKNSGSSFYGIVKAAFIIGIPLALLYWFSYSGMEISFQGISLKKLDAASDSLQDSQELATGSSMEKKEGSVFSPSEDTISSQNLPDSPAVLNPDFPVKTDTSKNSGTAGFSSIQDSSSPFGPGGAPSVLPEKTDTSGQRILLIGDSQAGGIMYALNDYCVENGHTLVGVFSWYSATCLNFGYSSRIDQLVETFKPTLVIIVLGLNELYARDIAKRTNASRQMQAKFGSIPYLWVGPANYMEDHGINKVFEATAGPERFVLSKNLELPRARDKRHPNQAGYKIWMDSIAAFVQQSTLYPFRFDKPKKTGSRIKAKVITANAAKNREY